MAARRVKPRRRLPRHGLATILGELTAIPTRSAGMRVGLGLILALALFGAARAQAPATPATPVRLSLSYDGRLYLKVLDLHFDESASGGDFDADANLRSFGVLALFNRFDVKASARGAIEDGAAKPGQFFYENHDGKRDRKIEVDWRPSDVVMSSSPAMRDLGHPPATLAQKLASADPLTQFVRMTLAANPGALCVGAPLFFDGKQLYALEFDGAAAAAPDAAERALGVTNLTHCQVTFREVAGFKPPKKHDTGLRSQIEATFGQLGSGGPWVLAKVTVRTVLGPAIIELKSVRFSRDVRVASE
jgi:hypothetical protein